MNTFAKSILNYFAAYTETRFRFQSKSTYKWTNDHLTCDFPVFQEFQKKILHAIKSRNPIELIINKSEYSISLDIDSFKQCLVNYLNTKYNLDYFNTLIDELRKEKIADKSTNDTPLTDEEEENIIRNSFRKFNLEFRQLISKVLYELQEDKKTELAHLIKDSAMPITSFNPKLIEQNIYDSIKVHTTQSTDCETFHKRVSGVVTEGNWILEMYDLYSMIRKFSTMLRQNTGNAYLFFHDLSVKQETVIENFPIFLIEISIEENPDSVTIRSERGVVFINTPAINSNNFESVLTIPRAARLVEAPDYILGVEKFIQSAYDFYNTFLLEQGFSAIVGEEKPRISFRIGMQIVQKEDRKLLDYSELITRIDAGQGGKFIDFIKDYISGNVSNTTDEVNAEFARKYPPKTANSFLSTIPLSLNDRQKRILTALENQKNKIIVIDGPPGTGKSYVIMAMVYWANQNNKSVVITSHKKAAIDVIDRMITDRFKELHPSAKPSIMRISRESSESVNNYQNTLASPVISAATNRFNEFNNEAVYKDIENWKSKVSDQTEHYWNNSSTYTYQLRDIMDFERLEQALIQKGLLTENIRPLKNRKSNIDIESLAAFLKSIPDNNDTLTVDNLVYLVSYKESVKKIIKACDTINTLPLSLDQIKGLGVIAASLMEDFKHILDEVEPFIKKDTSVIDCDLSFKLALSLFQRSKKEEISIKAKELSSLKNEQIVDNLEKLSGKKRNNLAMGDIRENLIKLHNIENSRQDINEYIQLCEKLGFKNAAIKEVYRFLVSIKSILENSKSDVLELLSALVDKYQEIILKSNLNPHSIHDLKRLFDKNGLHKDLFQYIYLFESLSKNENIDLPKQELLKSYYEGLRRQLENLNDSRLKNLNNHAGDISRIETTLSAGKRLKKEEAEVILKNISCILSEPDLISQFFPMEEDLIDVLIIDEASQVSIAESISLILRAKQVVILGDELQYGAVGAMNVNKTYSAQYFKEILESYEKDYHVSLGEEQKKALIEDATKQVDEDDQECEMVFKPEEGTKEWLKTFNIRTSTLNFARALRNYSISLDTHFRSFTEIIDYSNEFFYKESQIPLIVNRIRTKPIKEVLRFIKVDPKGNAGMNINLDEIEAIKNDIENIVSNGYKGTIGIITSFKEQKEQTEKVLRKEMNNFFKLQKEHKLTIWFVGDVQGEERDTVYYSFVEDKKIGNGSLKSIYPVPDGTADNIRKLKMQRLNVGFSRAKDSMVFVHSMTIGDYSDTRLGDALKHYKDLLDKTQDNFIEDDTVFGSEAEKELYRTIFNTEFYKMNRNNLKITAQFPVGKYIRETFNRYIPKYRVDFLVTLSNNGKDQSLILEYDGLEYHTKKPEVVTEHNFSQEYLDYDIERQMELESYGYRFLRINKFTLLPKEKGQTKVDVLNALFENKFFQ